MNDRMVEVLLRERVGGETPPDVRHAVYGADDRSRQRALARADAAEMQRAEGRSGLQWPALMVAAAATVVVTMACQVLGGERLAAPQHVERKVVKPVDFESWATLLGDVEKVRLRSASNPQSGALTVTLDASAVASLRQHLSKDQAAKNRFCRQGPAQELEFQLTKKRVMYARLQQSTGEKNVWALLVDGMATRIVPSEVDDVLSPWRRRLARARALVATKIRGGAALTELTRMKRASDIRNLVPASLHADDLALLSQLSGLRELDLTKSPKVSGATFAKTEMRDKVVTVSLLTTQMGDDTSWLGDLRKLSGLRITSADWVRDDTLMGAKCATCHRVKQRPAPKDVAGNLEGLTKTRRIQRLAVQGAVLQENVTEILAGLPLLRVLDLSGSDARDLAVKALARMPELRSLTLAGCFGIEPQDLLALTRARGLRRLDVRGVVDAETGAKLAAQMPNCDVRY